MRAGATMPRSGHQSPDRRPSTTRLPWCAKVLDSKGNLVLAENMHQMKYAAFDPDRRVCGTGSAPHLRIRGVSRSRVSYGVGLRRGGRLISPVASNLTGHDFSCAEDESDRGFASPRVTDFGSAANEAAVYEAVRDAPELTTGHCSVQPSAVLRVLSPSCFLGGGGLWWRCRPRWPTRVA